MSKLMCTCIHQEWEDFDISSAKMDANIMYSYPDVSDVIVVLAHDDVWYKIIGNAMVCKKHRMMAVTGLSPLGKIVYKLPEDMI